MTWILWAVLTVGAMANDEDIAACEGLELGDPCTRPGGGGGEATFCQEDVSDPTVLTCDDDAAATDTGVDTTGGGSGCDHTGGLAWAAAALAPLTLRRRR